MIKQDILKTKKEIYAETMKKLLTVWDDNFSELQKLHNGVGIRSSQIGALVMLLIKKGILK